jgi:predicted N-acetyltransferase YhbS
MPDMLARLYGLPEARPHLERAAAAGFTLRRADPWDRERVREFIGANFGERWSAEADLAFVHTPITAFLAVKTGEIVGFAVYEVVRRGFFGPTGVHEHHRSLGLGAALLYCCLDSMREMGYGYAIIGGVGPAEFYEKVCGAFVIPDSQIGVYGSLGEVMRRPA